MILGLDGLEVLFSKTHHFLEVLEVDVLLDFSDFTCDSFVIRTADPWDFAWFLLNFSHLILLELVLCGPILEGPEVFFEPQELLALSYEFWDVV